MPHCGHKSFWLPLLPEGEPAELAAVAAVALLRGGVRPGNRRGPVPTLPPASWTSSGCFRLMCLVRLSIRLTHTPQKGQEKPFMRPRDPALDISSGEPTDRRERR